MADQESIHNAPIHSSQSHAPELIPDASIAGSTPAAPMTGWKRIRFLFKVVEIRLRFILVLVATFVLIGKWDTIKNVWEKWTRPAAAEVRAASDSEYFCPMHPTVVRDTLEPDGSVPKCPICGMPLSLHKKGKHIDLPEGVAARVQLSPERIQMANVSTAVVEYRPLIKEVRAVGSVDYDERAARGSSHALPVSSRSSTWTKLTRQSTEASRWRCFTALICSVRRRT